MRSHVSIPLLTLIAIIIVWANLPQFPGTTVVAHQSQLFQGPLGVMVNPSSVVIKVGDKASVNVTVMSSDDVGQVCFSLEGFPESGFRTSFNPVCIVPQIGIASVLTVEATPAAAPQSFTASVIAKAGTQTAQASLNVTVEPAMSAWIPWLGLALFFLVLGIAAFWRPKLRFRGAKRR
jgi:hypothetical protein